MTLQNAWEIYKKDFPGQSFLLLLQLTALQ